MESSLGYLMVFCFAYCVSTETKRIEVNFERVDMYYVDPEYITDVTTNVAKLSRRSNYQLNFSANVRLPWYNNVTITLESYEFKDNQYKKSFIKWFDKFCDVLKKPLFWFWIPVMQAYGNLPLKCPVVGYIYAKDLALDLAKFPMNFPSSRWRFNITAMQFPRNKLILAYSVAFSFQEYTARIKAKASNH